MFFSAVLVCLFMHLENLCLVKALKLEISGFGRSRYRGCTGAVGSRKSRGLI